MKIGIIGLGKMGLNIAQNLKDQGHDLVGMDVSEMACQQAIDKAIPAYQTVSELMAQLPDDKLIWLMLPAGDITEQTIQALVPYLTAGDVLIDGGNANYKDSIRRHLLLQENEIAYMDCGVSGGISGARSKACLMIGGDEITFKEHEWLFRDLAADQGYLYAGPSGSGHYLKMVHNGIEYAMMQAIGEGFELLEASDYDFDLEKVAGVWNHGSVVRSWLMELAEAQFKSQPKLADISGVAAASGEAKWTVESALALDVPVPTIALSLFLRNLSQRDDSFAMKVVSALRNGFGGHAVVKK